MEEGSTSSDKSKGAEVSKICGDNDLRAATLRLHVLIIYHSRVFIRWVAVGAEGLDDNLSNPVLFMIGARLRSLSSFPVYLYQLYTDSNTAWW